VDRSRLEAFSDGVFAVAITLLALNLVVPGPGRESLAYQLSLHWPAFLAYLISFFTIGIIWVNHHMLVRTITSVDRLLLFLNLALLLFVVLIPFATSTVADYLTASSWSANVAAALYAGVFLGMALCFGGIFEWTLHGARVENPLPAEQRWRARIRFAGGGPVYVIAVLVALFSAVASFAVVAATAVYYIATPSGTSRSPDK
jgi:uncharacterized membrane protein